MKYYFLFALCIIPIVTFSQKKLDSTITSIGWIIKPGDTITYGSGNNYDKSFVYISSKDLFSLGEKAPIGLAGERAVVVKIIYDKIGKADFLITKDIVGIIKTQWYVDIEKAIKYGEIEIPQRYKQLTTTDRESTKADELKKLFELKQAGAITEEEYEAEKKKVLGR